MRVALPVDRGFKLLQRHAAVPIGVHGLEEAHDFFPPQLDALSGGEVGWERG